jgi:phenylacetate-CoA ligase
MLTHHWWGVAPGSREVLIWGSPIELNKQDRIKQFRDRTTNERLISSHDIGPASIAVIVERIRRFGPASIFGYPSSIEMLCELANDAGLSLRSIVPKAVFTTAEVLYDHQRQTISKAMGSVPVADNYGSREGGFISHQCPSGNMHIISENVIVEAIADGRPVGAGTDGEIVITHLDNLAMPFIRYRTGDIGQLSYETCPCGRGGMLMKVVQGRTNDMLVARDGRMVHGSMITYLMRDTPTVRRYQFIQESLDLTRLLLVADGRLPAAREKQICDGVTCRIGAPTSVSIEYVDQIPIASSGKFRYILTKLPAGRTPARL